jgi:hypothetical protein
MNYLAVLCLSVAVLASSTFAAAQDAPAFARNYKLGERATYTFTHSIKLMGVHTMSLDITQTATKLLPKGRAELKFHMSNLHVEENDTTKLADDLTIQTGAHNMPDKFTPTQGSTDIFEFIMMIAGSTTDKAAIVGHEEPWKWDGGPLTFSGTTKVLEITPDKKKMKALISGKLQFGGQEMGDLSFTTTYDLADGSMLQSDGLFKVAGIDQTMKFVRQAPGK